MWDHKVTDVVSIDETGAGTDYAAVAYCECGWQAGRWHHADSDGYQPDVALARAESDAAAHRAEYVAVRADRRTATLQAHMLADGIAPELARELASVKVAADVADGTIAYPTSWGY